MLRWPCWFPLPAIATVTVTENSCQLLLTTADAKPDPLPMLHPLFSTIVQRPDLVMDHLSAYGSLFHKEASSAGSALLARAVAGVVAILALVVFLGLAGTALMLGFLQNQFHWVLVIVPGVSLALLIVAIMVAMRPLKSERFSELKAQIDSDAQALRTVA